MRLQGRHKKDGGTEYLFWVGGPPPAAAQRTPVAPHIQMYNGERWNHDRQRMERRVLYVDSDNDYCKQEWYDLKTGELMSSKEGRLSDPDVHGKSARRSKSSSPGRHFNRSRATSPRPLEPCQGQVPHPSRRYSLPCTSGRRRASLTSSALASIRRMGAGRRPALHGQAG